MTSVHSSVRSTASRAALRSGRNVRTLRTRTRRSGAILLEVLISLGLMVFGLAIVGLQVTTSLETARKSQLWTTAIVLTETKMAELQAGAVQFKATDQDLGGYFGIRYPGYSWHIHIEPCEIENLYMMTLQIGYNPAAIEGQIANPDQEIEFDDQGTQILRTVHRLVPKPADLDLNRDFGIDLAGLQDQMGGGGQGGGTGGGQGGEGGEGSGGGDGANELWGLISDFLTKHPEILNDSGGIDLEAIKNLPPEDFQAAMEILQQFVGRGSQMSQLQNELSNALDEEGKGGKNGGGKNDGKNGNSNGNNDGDGQNDGGGTVGGEGNTGGGNRPDRDRRPRPGDRNPADDNSGKDDENKNNPNGGGTRNFGGPRNQPRTPGNNTRN